MVDRRAVQLHLKIGWKAASITSVGVGWRPEAASGLCGRPGGGGGGASGGRRVRRGLRILKKRSQIRGTGFGLLGGDGRLGGGLGGVVGFGLQVGGQWPSSARGSFTSTKWA